MEMQVEKLRRMVDELEVEKPTPIQKTKNSPRSKFHSNNQLDKTLSPPSAESTILRFSSFEEAFEAHQKMKSAPAPIPPAKKISNQLHSVERKTETQESSSSEKLLATAQTSLDDYHEVKQMYEEERERRQQLQSEIQSLVEECEIKKNTDMINQKNPSNNDDFSPSTSIAVDLAIRALSQELGVKHNRRATIGTYKIRSNYETPPSAQSGPIRKNPVVCVSRKLEQEFSSDGNQNSLINIPKRKLHVSVVIGEKDSHATYVIQIEMEQGWRMVQTRFRKFKYIYDWVKQHAEGGLLSLPAKLPGKGVMRGGSLSKRNTKKRRNWLEYTLQTVLREQPTLIDVLLDNINMIHRQQQNQQHKRRHSMV